MNDFAISFGKYLSAIRIDKHIKVNDIVNIIDCKRISYYFYESGKIQFPLFFLPKVCNILSVNIDDAFNLLSNPPKYTSNDEIDFNLLSNNIRTVRKNNNINQILCAQKLKFDKKTIYNYESGKAPNLLFIKTFCDYFSIKPSQLFYTKIQTNK